jgi:hypothetical protein
VTITDGDIGTTPVVTIVATDPTATEVPLTTGAFTLIRTGSTAAPLIIGWTASGTATLASGDRLSVPTNPVIPAGSASTTVLVTPIADGVTEAAETVVMTLKASAAYTIGTPSSATVTITDGVPPTKPEVTLVATDSWATENPLTTGTFTLTRTGSTAAALTVCWAASGTATLASGDRLSVPSCPIIPPGSASLAVLVTPIADGVTEPAETVIVTLKANAAYTIGTPSSATVTITDGGPDLFVSSLTGPTIVERGTTVTYSEATGNKGTATAGASVTQYYLSTNSIYDRLDALVSERSVPVLAAGAATRPYLTEVTIPLKAAAGTYYLIAMADGTRSVLELSESNNTRYMQVVVK